MIEWREVGQRYVKEGRLLGISEPVVIGPLSTYYHEERRPSMIPRSRRSVGRLAEHISRDRTEFQCMVTSQYLPLPVHKANLVEIAGTE